MEKQSTRKFLKLFVALVALFLLGSSALLLSSCKEEHTHDWGEGTVSVQPTCTAQGLKTFECSCGAVRTEPIQATGHKWEQEGEPVAPTCTMEGYTLYKCSVCGESEQRDVKPTVGHDFQPSADKSIPATCTSAGVNVYECSFCHTIYEQTVPATGHKWDEGTVVAPTCTRDGYTAFTCTECGYSENRNIVPATGTHQWEVTEVVEPNCIAGGYTLETCAACGETRQTNKTDKTRHDYDVTFHEATCMQGAWNEYECTFCGDKYLDYNTGIAALGHSYGANNDTTDTLYGAVVDPDTNQVLNDGELVIGKHQYTNVRAAKADGWTTVTAPTCESAGVFQRVCERCGTKETVNVAATGHYMSEGKVCVINNNLVDFEGNRIYAFECGNANCNIDVVIDNVGNTAHYIKAVDHTWVLDRTQSTAATCEKEGNNHYKCSTCDNTKDEKVGVNPHDWNTVRLDGKTPVVVCEADPALVGANAKTEYMTYMREQLGDKEYTARYTKLSSYFDSVASKQIAAICSDCGAIKEATGHKWVVGTLEEGKFAESDYLKNEDGTPVVAEGVTSETMTCRNVLVCSNAGCNKTNGKGPHGEQTDATCRADGICTVCGEPTDPQNSHVYLKVSTIAASWANSETKVDGTDYSQKQVYAAYQAVKSDVPFMNVVAATCTTDGSEAFVCVECLMDAYNGTTIDWENHITTVEKESDVPAVGTNAYTYYGYTMATTAGHEYTEVKYFRLNATDTSSPIVFEQTNCEFGFKTAYFCKNCDKLYVNEIVLDDPNTEADESDANTGTRFTDKDGFVLDVSEITDLKANLKAEEAAKAVVEDNRGAHSLFVYDEYYNSNGYVAPTCVSNAVIPYHCEHCGAIIVITYGAVDAERYEVNSDADITVRGEEYKNEVRTNDKDIDVKNHASEDKYACGTHCKAQDANGNYICGAFGEGYDSVAAGVEAIGTEDADHATVTVNYLFSTSVEYYDDTYELKLVDVENTDIKEGKIDWKSLTYRDADTASACEQNTTEGGDGSVTNNYKLPVAFTTPAAGKYFVLVNGDKYYPLETNQFSIWTDDDTTVSTGKEISGDITVTQNDTFFVRLNSGALNIPIDAVNEASLKLALAATPETVGGKQVLTVDVAKSFALEETSSLASLFTMKDGLEYVVNLNGNTLTQSADAQFVPTENVTFNNGTLNFTTTARADNESLIKPTGDVVFTLNNVTLKAASGTGVFARDTKDGETWNTPEIVIKGSTIEVPGYAVSTNASEKVIKGDAKVKITIENSTLKSTKTTGLFVNVLSDVKVSGSTIIGLQQAVMVRGGTVTITNSTLTLLKDTSDTSVTAETYNDKVLSDAQSQANYNLAYGDFAKGAFLEGFTKVEDYRIAGIWGTGNAVPRAVLTIGNVEDAEKAYQYATNVNIATNVKLTTEDENDNKIVVGSVYSKAFVTGLNGAAAVSLSCSAQDAAEVVLCWNSDAKDANNAKNTSLAGKIAAVAVNGTTINK